MASPPRAGAAGREMPMEGMEGMLWAHAPLGAIGIAWGVVAWMVFGWDARDLRTLWARGKKAARLLGRRLGATLGGPLRRVASSLGVREGRGEGVGLGDVSEMIDVVCLGLSAGLSFDAALALYCEHEEGPLAREMAEARLSWQMGMRSREDALMGVARATGVRALESFATAVGQALGLGAPLAQTLADQGRDVRAAHRAAIERQIEQAPVKLLIPTGTLILPALLLSILGPLLAAADMV